MSFNEITVTNCWSAGPVGGEDRVGGLVGSGQGMVASSFWDTGTGLRKSAGGVGKTTAQMQTRSTFTDTGWDFVGEDTNGAEDIWTIRKEEYPRLAWELDE